MPNSSFSSTFSALSTTLSLDLSDYEMFSKLSRASELILSRFFRAYCISMFVRKPSLTDEMWGSLQSLCALGFDFSLVFSSSTISILKLFLLVSSTHSVRISLIVGLLAPLGALAKISDEKRSISPVSIRAMEKPFRWRKNKNPD